MVIDLDPMELKNDSKEDNVMPFPGGKGMKQVKTPSKKQLQGLAAKLAMDNQHLADCLNTAGLILCAVHRASLKLYNEMGGKIVSPALERYKKRVLELQQVTANYNRWDKSTEEPDDGNDGNEGQDSDAQGSAAGIIS